jgi:hypothetical protein
MEMMMNTRRVLSTIFLLVLVLTPVVASACPEGQMCWPGAGRGYRSGHHGHYGTRWGGRYYRHEQAIVVERRDPNIRVEREPGLIDIPLKILDVGLGFVLGRTKLVDTSCADDDVACHRAKGRAEGRYDGKAAVADATENASYREAYNDMIRNSGQPVEAPAPAPEE